MSTKAASLPIERLCRHHVVSGFRCGDESFDIILQEYHRHVYDSYEDVTVLALIENKKVVGYIAYQDMYLGTSEKDHPLRMFFIPAFAISLEYQRGVTAARRLIDASFEALDRRVAAGHRYDGIAGIPHTNPRIEKLLDRLGFTPLKSNAFFWSKRLPPPE